ncbi:MAG TPA: VWA domain-containing protein [Verrucomicrobiae bacterium]|jgi:Ca-activated chloride channel family protein|nr:VWA domain-containing protein [Verrucomicrobiae bacterium]
MEFRHPFVFILALLIPLVFFFAKGKRRSRLPFSNVHFFPGRPLTTGIVLYRLMPWVRALVLLLFIAALARPQRVSAEREYQTSGVDIMISMDISGSMLAEDFKPENRMGVGKEEAIKFIKGRENDRIGFVVFARKAFTQCPLTLDYDVLINLIEQVHVGMIPDGTAVGMGLATAVNRLRGSEAKSKVIILITDGENNAGNIDPITAAELAKTFGIRVYTICIGRGGLVPFPVNDPLFGKRYVQANVEVDEMSLKRIADITGGQFFRARDPESLHSIYQKIDSLEKTEVKVKEYRSYDEFFHYFLFPALTLLLAELFFSNTILLKVP